MLITQNNQQQLKLSDQAKQLQQKELQSQKQQKNLLIAGAALFLLTGLYFLTDTN